jgi:DNA-binding response OmpR family regulator
MPGAHILLVEDDEELREVICRNLRARGHNVIEAGDAQTALANLCATTFDLVLLDINLPDQTGWDVLRISTAEGWIRPMGQPGHPEMLPVVILSAVRVNPRRVAEFHPLAYLPKPFPMEALLRISAEMAERRSAHPESA